MALSWLNLHQALKAAFEYGSGHWGPAAVWRAPGGRGKAPAASAFARRYRLGTKWNEGRNTGTTWKTWFFWFRAVEPGFRGSDPRGQGTATARLARSQPFSHTLSPSQRLS